MNHNAKKLFVTGGHITPALAVVDELKKIHPDWEIVLIGRNTLEERFAREKNIGYLWSCAGRLTSVHVAAGFFQAFTYCIREKPDCIISFGGYVAFPVCIAAWVLGIPIITHEQTRVPGLANRIIAYIARRICVTFADTYRQFPKEKTVLTGLPIRKEIFEAPKSPPFPVDRKRPLIYITGGSTGAVSLNDMIFPILSDLTSRYTIIHQTGRQSLAKANEIHSAHYIARDYFDVHTVAWVLSQAKLVIARSGANTVMELAVLTNRAILIPLPWSAGGEQQKNAEWLADLGFAKVIDQKSMKPESLRTAIEEEITKPDIKNHTIHSITTNGACRVVRVIDAILG